MEQFPAKLMRLATTAGLIRAQSFVSLSINTAGVRLDDSAIAVIGEAQRVSVVDSVTDAHWLSLLVAQLELEGQKDR
jgi:hypothetical protein